jgi:hypothetical protein
VLPRQLQLLHRLSKILDLNQSRRSDEVTRDCAAVAAPEEDDQDDVAEEDDEEGPEDVELKIRD